MLSLYKQLQRQALNDLKRTGFLRINKRLEKSVISAGIPT